MEVEGAIELPAEANPLTEGLLFHSLRSAASSNPHQIQTGTKQLQQWEKESGYYVLLQSAFMEKSLPVEVRHMAIIQLKNGIDKYWRKTASNAVSKNDRVLIRSRLLESGMNEADQRLALQNALVIAKILRFEFPNDWPDAITQIIELLRRSAQPDAFRLHLPRTLLILLSVIKELASGRLMRTKASLQSVTPELFTVLGSIYVSKSERWQTFLREGGDDEGGALDDIEQSLLAIKVLRRLIIAGYEFPNREKEVREFCSIVRAQLRDILSMVTYTQSPLSNEVRRLLEKHLVQFSKLHLEMIRTHPAAFALLPDSLGLVRAYWGLAAGFGEQFGTRTADSSKIGTDGDVDEEKPVMERLSLKALLIIRACVKMVFQPAHTFKLRQQEEKDEQKQATELFQQQLLTDSFVKELLEVVVSRFFVFTPRDLREWEEEPDEWEKQQEGEGDTHEFSLRPCAEKLFLDLAINYKDLVVQPLLATFYAVAPPDNENVLLKDSVYTAVGLAAPVLHQHLDFDTFISNSFSQEVQKQAPGYNLLRRRIAILLGQWITIKVSEASRPLVYQIFQHLLHKSDPLNDLVVRLTAGRHFKSIVDDWEFKPEQFLPFAGDVLSQLMMLIGEVELGETKMILLNTIGVIVERLEHHITPYAGKILSLLPPLWEQSGEEHLMKQAILTMLTRLITAMKADSRSYHALAIPIIRGAVEPGSETQLYLLEDALDLWSAVISQTPAPASGDLLALIPYLLHALTLGSESLRMALDITESYILLAPQNILTGEVRVQFLRVFAEMLGTLRQEANGVVTHVVEVLVRAADGLGGQQAVSVLAKDMVTTGFAAKLLEGIRNAWEAHQTSGPNRKEQRIDIVVETDYFSVIARIALASPRVFCDLINSEQGADVAELTKWVLEEWFTHFENIGDPTRRKLMALALTKLLETGQPWILNSLQNLMTVWTDVVTELVEGNDDRSIDSLVWSRETSALTDADTAGGTGAPEAPEDIRRRELIYSDPIHTVNLISFIREHLQGIITACGGSEAFHTDWLVNVDRDVVAAFSKLEGVAP